MSSVGILEGIEGGLVDVAGLLSRGGNDFFLAFADELSLSDSSETMKSSMSVSRVSKKYNETVVFTPQ